MFWYKTVFLGLHAFSNVNVQHKGLQLQDWVYRLGSKLHNCNDSNTHLLGGCVVINQKECHSWCSNHVQTANYFNTLTVEMLNLFYYPKFKSSVPKSLCYIKMYSQLNFRSVIYSYLFSMSAVVLIQVEINFP